MNAHAGDKPTFSIAGVLLLALVFHLVFINSVFDCYFTSHVVHGMQHFRLPTDKSRAKRLVLLVGDGLRADLFFNRNAFMGVVPDAPEYVAPYLRGIAQYRGAFGISHTRVPTESRPGHVALIGGMYEDVSAVTKGWKTNPVRLNCQVDFDSVFNQSSHTYSFGSPDILPMFARGASPGKVDMWMYDEDDEDFTKDATELDVWSLDHLKALLKNATDNSSLNEELRQEKVVFFLHLLGLDTTGHSYRPFSKEYMQNIMVVDDIVRQTEGLVSSFYDDEETAYVFTADHGMSIIGNHGDGHPDNTRTPLIAWGKGVRGPIPNPSTISPLLPSSHDVYSALWELGDLYRQDVEQADITALMSALIGTDWPVNSVGVLPDVDGSRPGYLDWSDDDGGSRAEAALTNAKVLLEHYRVKHDLKRSHAWRYQPFGPLESQKLEQVDVPGQRRLEHVSHLITNQDHDKALQETASLIQDTLKGLRYLDTYDRTLIRMIVMIAYSGWIAYSGSLLLAPTATASPIWTAPFPLASLAVSWAFFISQHAAYTFYVYVAFPIYFWHHAISRISSSGAMSSRRDAERLITVGFGGTIVVGALLSMVAGYTHRYVWSIIFVLMGVIWPLAAWPQEMASRSPALFVAWVTSCLVSAIFPLLSVNKKESIPLILAGAASMVGVASLWMSATRSSGRELKGFAYEIIMRQLALLLPTAIVTATAAAKLSAKEGLPKLLQGAGWVVLATSLILPFMGVNQHQHQHSKLLSLFLAFCPLFVILSISTEGLFYVAYSSVLVLWVEVEAAVKSASIAKGNMQQLETMKQQVQNGQKGSPRIYIPRVDDVRIALFFLFFVQVGFFGTGNVASMSSFYLAPVYRLVPTFRPFIMAALLILKILAPYVPLSAAFAALHVRLNLPSFSLFLVALTLTDVMTVYFFFDVRDEGSWLEIGQSISFYCITSLLCVFSCGVCAAGEWLVGDMMRRQIPDHTSSSRDDPMEANRVDGLATHVTTL